VRTPGFQECEQGSFQFQGLGTRKVVADFTGGTLSGDGEQPDGVLLWGLG